MDNQICLDTDIIIELLKDNEKIVAKLHSHEAEFLTTPINVLEIWSGRKEIESQKIDSLINNLYITSINKEEAKKAGDMTKELREKGEIIDMRDIIIASSCIQNNISLMTLNTKHFERLKQFGLKLV